MKDKVALMTGITGAIGKATAVALAELGATIVGVSRQRGSGETAVTGQYFTDKQTATTSDASYR